MAGQPRVSNPISWPGAAFSGCRSQNPYPGAKSNGRRRNGLTEMIRQNRLENTLLENRERLEDTL